MTSYVAVVVVIAVIALAWTWGMGLWGRETPGSVTLGVPPFESSILVFIAEDRELFSGNGLNVTVRSYSSGGESGTGLMNNETDIAFTSEYVALQKMLDGQDIRVIATAARYQSLYLVAPEDAGIATAADLDGTTIGLRRNGPQAFYLGRFLDLHGMSIEDVTLVDMTPPQYGDALANGSTDAVVTASMYINPIEERLERGVVRWPVQSNQPGYNIIATRGVWADTHPEEVQRILTSLAQAEEYAIAHPDETKALAQRRLNYTDAEMARIWPEYQISLRLDRALLTALNDEARWMVANNLTTATTVPDLREYVDTTALATVRPDAVSI